jgi:hypothetical protein
LRAKAKFAVTFGSLDALETAWVFVSDLVIGFLNFYTLIVTGIDCRIVKGIKHVRNLYNFIFSLILVMRIVFAFLGVLAHGLLI